MPNPLRLPLSPRQAEALSTLLEKRLGAEMISELGADAVSALREVAEKLEALKESR